MELRELQLYKLEILKEITEICEGHGLKYVLSSGTLLGAIRHNGYIPWDDDVDISLMWNDYLELLNVLREDCPDRFFVQNLWTDKNYPCLWTQLRVNGTTSMPKKLAALDMHWGICIDIFPMFSVSDDDEKFEKQKKAFRLARALLAKELMCAKGESPTGAQRLLNMLPNGLRHGMVKGILKKYAYQSSADEYMCDSYNAVIRRKYRYADMADVEKHSFEGYMMNVPRGYDAILTGIYGDYMTPPPPEKRGGHELNLGDTIIDVNKDYREYRRELLGDNSV